MEEKGYPIEVVAKEKVSVYDDPGTLVSRLGDRNFLNEFRKVLNMPKNSKVWLLLNIGDSQLLGQAMALHTGWKVTIFDNRIEGHSMMPIVKFFAGDRASLEELMYSAYLETAKIVEGSDGDGNENEFENT